MHLLPVMPEIANGNAMDSWQGQLISGRAPSMDEAKSKLVVAGLCNSDFLDSFSSTRMYSWRILPS